MIERPKIYRRLDLNVLITKRRRRCALSAHSIEKSGRQPLLSAAFNWTERSMVELNDLFLLLLTPATIVKPRQPRAEQRQGSRLRGSSRSRRKAEGDTVVPEEAVWIETKRDLAAIHEVRAQDL